MVIDLHTHTNFSDGTDTPNGIITKAPTKFRQKIIVGMGIVALAIIGPEEPIPRTPKIRNGISRPVGSLV